MNNTVEMFKDFLAYFFRKKRRYDFICAERKEWLNDIPLSFDFTEPDHTNPAYHSGNMGVKNLE